MALLDDIRSHLAVANEDQRKRRGAVLLREAADEIERLRAIMASESDRPKPVASTLSESSTPGEGTSQRECAEPVAFAVLGDGYEYVSMMPEMCGAWAQENGGRTVPLYRSPTLTDAEREALEIAVEYVGSAYAVEQHAQTLRGLLERTT